MTKKLIILFAAALFSAALYAGCDRRAATFVPGEAVYEPVCADGFTIYEAGRGNDGDAGNPENTGSRVIRITDPWQGAEGVEQWVFVAHDGEEPPAGFKGTVLPAPARRIVAMSSSYVAFLNELGAGDRVAGVSGGGYITDSLVRARLAAGDIADVGYDAALDFERLAALRPDLMLVYGVNSGDEAGVTGKLREAGIPYVYVGDYLESSPQGRAEWLVAVATMCGMFDEGVRRFGEISRAYDALKARAAKAASAGGKRPEVMLNAPYRDVWFVPGDDNYMVRLVRDAGGEYVFRDTAGHDSRPVDVEEAFAAMQGADFWLCNSHHATLASLLADNPRFANAPPVREGRVYNNNARTTPGGGSDFWESGVVRPDVMLRDMVRILHPEAAEDTTLYYYKKLQ